MKRFLTLSLMLLTFILLSACSPANEQIPATDMSDQQGNHEGDEENIPDIPTTGKNGPYLILFCSRTSNTERLAQQIQSQLDCDILEVQPVRPYEEDYNAMLSRAQEELAAIQQGNYPPISTSMDNFDKYDVIFVGYPIWYGSIATPIQTFLHEHASKLAGKHIALFATSGGSGISTSVDEAAELCPESEILSPTLLLTSSQFSEMDSRVTSWLEQLNIQTANNNNMGKNQIRLTANGKSFTATLVENSSTEALKARLSQSNISIQMNDYGDMEKVGSLGFSLPRNDQQITTSPGDLILYQGNSFVIYYDTNSWNFTRLGKIDGASTREQVLDLLDGKGEVTVALSLK